MAFNVSNDYKRIIYSQDDDNDIKIWFNNVELANAGYLTEKLEGTFRVLANDGKKRFSLDNFVAKELTLTIHDVNLNAIQDQVKISIGTLVNNQYEYVPIGVFNIQDIPTTNNGTTTIKLRDNRVKFEFNYDAFPLINNQYRLTTDTNYLQGKSYYTYNSQDEIYELLVDGVDYEIGDAISGNVYEEKGTVTYKQILDDICQKAGVVNKVTTFDGDAIETSFFDNSIKGNIYVTFIAEQGGYVPIIDREGALDFVDLNNAYVWRIPLSIMSDNYQIGTSYSVQRVVYESGIIKYETSSDETLNTLYLDASNPFIISQAQINNILTKFANFEIDSVSFTNAILGNPAIDPYDIIEVYDDEDVNEAVIFRTLANHTYTFNGKHRQLFDTQIDKEARKENVTKNSDIAFKRWAKTTIDGVEAQVQITAQEITNVSSNIATLNVATESISSEVASQTTAINEMGQTISQINSVIQEQTSDAITTWFNQSGIQGTLDDLQEALGSDVDGEESGILGDLKTVKSYYKVALDTDQSSSHYGQTYVELGADTNQTKIRIYPDIIQFLTNGVETAYISNNSLYINESTILTRQEIGKEGIGRWVTEIDNSGNLNTFWND